MRMCSWLWHVGVEWLPTARLRNDRALNGQNLVALLPNLVADPQLFMRAPATDPRVGFFEGG